MFKSKRSTMMSILMVLAFVAGISGLAIVAINGLTTEAEAVTITPGALGCHYHTGEGVHCDRNDTGDFV
jgi:hypothetical protein